MSSPVLHLLAGPNGAGKTTFVHEVLQPITNLPFINADIIAADRWPGDESAHAYDASDAAATARSDAMAMRRSFITETVFSHPSKVELVRLAVSSGYLVSIHAILIPEDIAVLRVDHRVAQGGHPVPESKVRERYRRLWNLVADARDIADRTTFYDNASARSPFRPIAHYERGRLVGEATWPAWTPLGL